MIISVLISILLQLGLLTNASDFDEAKTQQYIDEVQTSNSIIIEDDTFI